MYDQTQDQYRDKVAVITGGNSGIGLATAKEFAARGAHVAIFGRDTETLEEAKRVLGEGTLAVQGDVTKLADLERLFAEVKDTFGRVDVLFVNAGRTTLGGIEEVTEETFDTEIDVNLKGAFFTVQKALPLMGKGSAVVFTSSCLADMAMPGSSAYSASKAAVNSLVKVLSAELTPRGIRVNAVSPGPINTPIYGRMGMAPEQLEAFAGQIQGQVPVGRFGDPAEIAKAVAFLASSDASFVMGANLSADGGMSL